MTDEEKQARDANSQAAMEAKKQNSASQLQGQKDQGKLQQISAQGMARAAEKVLQHLAENTMTPLADQPGAIGEE
jgi:hypothetical protein